MYNYIIYRRLFISKTLKNSLSQIDDAIKIRYKPPFPKINEFKEKSFKKNDSPIISDLIVRLAKNGVGFAVIRKVDDTIL